MHQVCLCFSRTLARREARQQRDSSRSRVTGPGSKGGSHPLSSLFRRAPEGMLDGANYGLESASPLPASGYLDCCCNRLTVCKPSSAWHIITGPSACFDKVCLLVANSVLCNHAAALSFLFVFFSLAVCPSHELRVGGIQYFRTLDGSSLLPLSTCRPHRFIHICGYSGTV